MNALSGIMHNILMIISNCINHIFNVNIIDTIFLLLKTYNLAIWMTLIGSQVPYLHIEKCFRIRFHSRCWALESCQLNMNNKWNIPTCKPKIHFIFKGINQLQSTPFPPFLRHPMLFHWGTHLMQMSNICRSSNTRTNKMKNLWKIKNWKQGSVRHTQTHTPSIWICRESRKICRTQQKKKNKVESEEIACVGQRR